jgi:hypothetical protein
MRAWLQRPLIAFLCIFAVAFGVRTALTLKYKTYDELWDGCEMTRAARNIARHGDMANVFADDSGPSAHLAPLYPAFRGILFRTFGEFTLPTRGLQMALATACACATFGLLPLLALRLGLRPGAGLAAGLLLALWPFNLRMETFGTWEQTHTALMLFAVLFAVLHLHHDGWRSRTAIVGTGLLLGLAGLLNPSLLLTGGLLLAAAWWRPSAGRLRVTVASGAILALALLCLTPWLVRNYIELGGFVPVRSNFGMEFLIGNNPEANGTTFGTFPDDTHSLIFKNHPYPNKLEQAHYKEIGELAYYKEKQQLALRWIGEHPLQFLGLTVLRFRWYWFPISSMWPSWTPLRVATALSYWPFGLGCLLGVASLVRGRHPYRWFVVAAVFGPSLAYMATHVDPRYRYPTFALSVLVTCHYTLPALAALGRFPAGVLLRTRAAWSVPRLIGPLGRQSFPGSSHD